MARQIADTFKVALVSTDRLRSELFDNPVYDTQENQLVEHLASFMTSEFLSAGVGVVFDGDNSRISQRRKLRELVRKYGAENILIWIQLDIDTAFGRTQRRDRRTLDDKFAQEHTQDSFDRIAHSMQNPQSENYVVISGKHTFTTQKNAILSKLYSQGVIATEAVQGGVSKPGLVNLVPTPSHGRVDLSRRSIIIR